MSSWRARLHAAARRIKSTLGRRRGGARAADDDFSLAVPFPARERSDKTFRTAAMVHLFHTDMAPQFRAVLHNVPEPCDLLFTTDTAEKKTAVEQVFQDWDKGRVDVVITPNRGRDIAPKLTAFADRYSEYALLLFLHSKRSSTSDLGNEWFDQLTGSLCGSEAIVRSVFSLFDKDAALGMVVPQTFEPVRHYMTWDGNEDAANTLAIRLGTNLDLAGTLDFPAGSMFWARPSALHPLLDLKLQPADFPEEDGQVRGTLAHAVERMFLLICEKAGYRWCKIAAPDLYENRETILDVSQFPSLSAAMQATRFDVSNTMLAASHRK